MSPQTIIVSLEFPWIPSCLLIAKPHFFPWNITLSQWLTDTLSQKSDFTDRRTLKAKGILGIWYEKPESQETDLPICYSICLQSQPTERRDTAGGSPQISAKGTWLLLSKLSQLCLTKSIHLPSPTDSLLWFNSLEELLVKCSSLPSHCHLLSSPPP